MSQDWVELVNVEIDAIIGINDEEQRRPQRLLVDVRVGINVEDASQGDLGASIDYASLHEQVITLAQYGQWRLLETLAVAIARLVLAPPGPSERRAHAHQVEVSLRKPDVLKGAVAGVTMRRPASWCDLGTRMVPSRTWLDTLVTTPRAGAYRAHIEGGSTWEVPPGAAVHLISGDVLADGRPVALGARLARGACRGLRSREGTTSTLLVVSCPPLQD
jgi:FolB domain-containing protein